MKASRLEETCRFDVAGFTSGKFSVVKEPGFGFTPIRVTVSCVVLPLYNAIHVPKSLAKKPNETNGLQMASTLFYQFDKIAGPFSKIPNKINQLQDSKI
jgi:hypothetical protein